MLQPDTSETIVTGSKLYWFMILPRSIAAHDYFKDETTIVALQDSNVPFFIIRFDINSK